MFYSIYNIHVPYINLYFQKKMEELAESLANSFSVSNEPNTTDAPHPRFSDYKKKTTGSDQQGRRHDILEQQKK